MADVDIVIRTIDQSRLDGTIGKFTELNSAIMIMRQGLEAAKKVYEFGKEGAQLDALQTRFDRLSASIGTTSDALLGDLRTATRGMYSDFELIANVTDLVGLGLAKDHAEAVRLSRVAAGLNMNMNQLVLTLTNMTTMRFDALGVSVDGFDDKLQTLEKQGYSTNDAFKEAFLQQAEAQLLRVGEAADTTAGTFARLESELKNFSDAFKLSVAVAVEPLIKSYLDNVDALQYNVEAYAKLTGTVITSRAQYDMLREDVEKAGETMREMAAATGETDDFFRRAAEGQREYSEAIDTTDYEGLLENILNLQDGLDRYRDTQTDLNGQIAELNQLHDEGKISTGEYEEKLSALNDKLDENALAAEEWSQRFVFSMIQARLAADGFTQGEFNFLMSVGEQMGLIDEETATMATNLNNSLESIDLTKPEEYSTLWQNILDMPVAETEQSKVDEINTAVGQINTQPVQEYRDVYQEIVDMPRDLTFTLTATVVGMEELMQFQSLWSGLMSQQGVGTRSAGGMTGGGGVTNNYYIANAEFAGGVVGWNDL